MVYEKNGYELYTRKVKLKGGRDQVIYFFGKKGNKPKSGSKCDLPVGYVVGINKRTGLPYLKKA
jgi:hypothetical protein